MRYVYNICHNYSSRAPRLKRTKDAMAKSFELSTRSIALRRSRNLKSPKVSLSSLFFPRCCKAGIKFEQRGFSAGFTFHANFTRLCEKLRFASPKMIQWGVFSFRPIKPLENRNFRAAQIT